MKKIILVIVSWSMVLSASTFNKDMQSYIEELKSEAKKNDSKFVDFSAQRGEKIFTTSHIGKKGKEISCVSCHTADLRTKGKNIHTYKILEPLAPSANQKRLTNASDVKKWLRRNFNDVYNRVGTASEQGDVLYYINSK